jgi:hypothetical protein
MIGTNSTSGGVVTPSPQALYAHQETTTIGGLTYYFASLASADASGTTLSASAGLIGRILMGQFVYPLTGVASIPAGTWNFVYRASRGSSVVAHCDVDLLITMSNGSLRSTIATAVAASANLPGSLGTVSGTYSWASYNVVQQTDFLEINYYINVTQAKPGRTVALRIDDKTLPLTAQTGVTSIFLPTTYDYVLRASNTVTNSWQIRLSRYSDSGIGRLQNCTIYFRRSSGEASSQIAISDGLVTIQTGPWFSMSNVETIYIAMTVQEKSTGTSAIYAYLEVLTPGSTTSVQYALAFRIT